MHVNSRGCPGCSRSRRATKVQTAEQVHIVYLNAVKPSEYTVLSGDQSGSRPMTTAKNNNGSQRFSLMDHFFLYLDMFHIPEHCYRAERFLMAVLFQQDKAPWPIQHQAAGHGERQRQRAREHFRKNQLQIKANCYMGLQSGIRSTRHRHGHRHRQTWLPRHDQLCIHCPHQMVEIKLHFLTSSRL